MPLKEGSDHKTVSFNIKELVKAGNEKGHIGNDPNESSKKRHKRAIAIALNKAGKSNKQ